MTGCEPIRGRSCHRTCERSPRTSTAGTPSSFTSVLKAPGALAGTLPTDTQKQRLHRSLRVTR